MSPLRFLAFLAVICIGFVSVSSAYEFGSLMRAGDATSPQAIVHLLTAVAGLAVTSGGCGWVLNRR